MQNQKASSSMSSNGSATSKSGNKASMKHSQLMELFEHGLKDIYYAENALVKAIPILIENATSQELIDALTAHLLETKAQVTRLDKVFASIKVKAAGEKCDAMEGLIKEADSIMESCEKGSMRDAGIISAAQKVEHYEIATYGTLRQFAETLDLSEAEKLLSTTLQEEKEADRILSDVAMEAVNVEASEEMA